MKTMTCKQMGGSCDFKVTAEIPIKMMEEGIKHMEKKHPELIEEMKRMSAEENEKWNDNFMKNWEKIPYN